MNRTIVNSLLVLLLLSTILGVFSQTSSTCSLTLEQLKAVRLNAAAEWVDKVNYDLARYKVVANKYLSPFGSTTINFVGTFGPRTIAIEYGELLYTGSVTLSFGKIYPTSVRWLNDNTLYYQMPYQIQNDFYGNSTGYTAGVFNAIETEILTFDPESCEVPQILSSFIIEDPNTRAFSEASGKVQSTDINTICYLITEFACRADGQYGQFEDITDCIVYYNSKVPSNAIKGLCPQPFSSKTFSCALIHLTSAFIDAEHHCPHVGKFSATCQDRCVPDCNSCARFDLAPYPLLDTSTNAFCDTAYVDYITPGYTCKCLDGTVSRDDLAPVAGRTYCQPIPCVTDKDCPVKKGTGYCSSGKCVPARGFTWDSSVTAQQARNMSVCLDGGKIRKDKNNKLNCVKPGYCLPDSNNARDCAPFYDPSVVSCKPIDTQDYGLPADFPKRDWGCVCKQGYEGGLGFPCLPSQVSSPASSPAASAPASSGGIIRVSANPV
jgi:hypothetical protein